MHVAQLLDALTRGPHIEIVSRQIEQYVSGGKAHVGADALVRPAERSSAAFWLARLPGRGRPGLRDLGWGLPANLMTSLPRLIAAR